MGVRTKLNLSIEEELLEKFKQFCKDNGMLPSHRISLLIKKDLKESGTLHFFIKEKEADQNQQKNK